MAQGRVIPYGEARRLKARNPHARWSNIAEGFAGEVWPELNPSFRLSAGETVFTIGSCFARNIERHLVSLGCRVPMMEFYLPPEEWSGSPNSAMNKFHPPSFRQCLEWIAAIHDRDGRVTWEDCDALAFPCGEDRWFDMDMGAAGLVSQERFLERRQHIYDIFSTVFAADCLMMTPGLIEAWRDRTNGFYIHEAPTQKAMVAQRDRWELEILPYETCLADMLATIDVVRARNPAIKVLVTTSPVPMSSTFSGEDVRIANTYSKSVLRAACGAAAMQRPMVDYFPSYESATLSFPADVWQADRIHVSSGFIGKIVAHLLDHYLEGVEEAARRYQQALTLLHSGAYGEAEEAARATLAVRSEHVEARIVLAEALIRLHRCAEAEAELRALLELHPDRADLWIALARAVVRGDKARAPEAVGHVQTAMGLPSIALNNLRAVAELLRRQAPPDAAEAIARRAVALFPLHVEAYPLLVDVLIDQGRKPEAIDVLKRATTLRRAPAPMYLQLAELLAEAGDIEGALAPLSRLLALEPSNADALAMAAALRAPKPAPDAAEPSEEVQAPPTAPKGARPSLWSALFRSAPARAN